ncbi:uncharacterized protein TNIN_271851 [Trichonephila inaurata madagascariensis]|uniref:Serine/threonine-protein phosphatase 2A regulatory subunit B'' subunit alpha/beta/delta EF-hand domain-containing protein n=1 Tax=Trichonephila inaurata madagascariensis TaxID=2747483 RepID=A0A8X6XS30_9ARAC|nr:uncharacterized protein TNIN_271851 [Trichonephila inaurata madagascariensis]
MLTNHVSCHYVVTSVTFYHSALVDLTRTRSVHAVEHDPCCPDPTKLSADECKAVHYGLCSPLLKLPSFSIPPVTTSSPPSPATPKGSSSSPLVSSTPSSPVTPKGSAPTIAELLSSNTPNSRNTSTTVGSPVLQRSTSPIVSSPIPAPISTKMSTPSTVVSSSNSVNPPRMDMEMLDPVSLLASDLEGQLEALVSTFVAQDKVRLAARKKSETTGGTFKSSPSATKSVSPIKKYDKKIKDDRSSGDESASSLSSETSQTSKSNGFAKGKSGPKVTNIISEPTNKDSKMLSHDTHTERNTFPFDNNKPLNNFGAHYDEHMFERSSSPSFKSSILPSLKPSPEYQQTGVKAQITKFASKEKDALQNSPTNSLERRQALKNKPGIQEPYSMQSMQPRSGPLTLDALQEMLLNSSAELVNQPIQTTVFQNRRIPGVPFGETAVHDIPHTSQIDNKFVVENYVPFYVNEACKESDELAASMKPSTSQGLGYHSPNFGKSGQDHVQSAVDYAKTRIQNVQQGLRDETKPKTIKNGHLVSDAKTKWENIPNWNDHHLVTDMDNSLPEPLQRGGHKRTLSMDGLLDVPSPSIPHPKLTTAQKQHIKERSLSPTDRHSHVPIRPFLTKGSVAERVLLFECCPDRALERASAGNKSKQNLISTWRPGSSDVQNKTHSHHGLSEKDKNSVAPTSPRTSSLRRAIKSGKRDNIPRFYYKDGKPQSPQDIEAHLKKVAAVFAGLNDGKASREEFGIITKACGLPLYWKLPLFLAARGEKKLSVSCDAFLEYWRR